MESSDTQLRAPHPEYVMMLPPDENRLTDAILAATASDIVENKPETLLLISDDKTVARETLKAFQITREGLLEIKSDATIATVQEQLNKRGFRAFIRELLGAKGVVSEEEITEVIREASKEGLKVIELLSKHMDGVEDWLEFYFRGKQTPKLRRVLSHTSFFPFAVAGSMRSFLPALEDFWEIRLRRNREIKGIVPDESLLNEASSHSSRIQVAKEDQERLDGTDPKLQLALVMARETSEFFEDPANAILNDHHLLVCLGNKRLRLSVTRQWYTGLGNVVTEDFADLLNQLYTETNIPRTIEFNKHDELYMRSAAYRPYSKYSSNPFVQHVYTKDADGQNIVPESQVVWLLPTQLELQEGHGQTDLLSSMREPSFITMGVLSEKVCRPLFSKGKEGSVISEMDVRFAHRYHDGLDGQDEIVRTLTDLSGGIPKERVKLTDWDVNVLPKWEGIPPMDASAQRGELLPDIATEFFAETTFLNEQCRELFAKMNSLRERLDASVDPDGKGKSVTLADVMEVAGHLIGFHAGQMVVAQKKHDRSSCSVGFSLFHPDLAQDFLKYKQETLKSEKQRWDLAQELLYGMALFIREKRWAQDGEGTAALFSTLAGQLKAVEHLFKTVGNQLATEQITNGINRQDFMLSIVSNLSRFPDPDPSKPQVVDFVSAQTDSLRSKSDKNKMGAMGVIIDPNEGLRVTLRSTFDQRWESVQGVLSQFHIVDKADVSAWKKYIFDGNTEAFGEWQAKWFARERPSEETWPALKQRIQEAIEVGMRLELEAFVENMQSLVTFLDQSIPSKYTSANRLKLFKPDGKPGEWRTDETIPHKRESLLSRLLPHSRKR